ncbi:cobyrinate a,c-diamide synthase [Saccharomonospora azurea]|uniref:cobyrinate a,c-diamide synthase n=1 Tax=Saccharomonospora azurea TaxID=40988 RepID=UPI00159D9604|nr:cobyrinate a,c-diamide synthase [Saccharomonospora azurea]
MVKLPRILVAAPASGHGKTTLATGLMAALARRGLAVSGHKVGPDYIDPGYHALATGRPGRNLDPHLVGESLVVPLLQHGSRGADVAVVEGAMGLFDGQIGGAGFASTAHIATLTRTPVVLVVDISHASRSIGAVVHGMRTFQPGLTIAGVVLNKAGSPRHAAEAATAVEAMGVPVLGILHRDDHVSAPSRHLGLVPAAERAQAAAALESLAERVAEHVDLDAVLELADGAPDLDAQPWNPAAHVRPATNDSPVVAVAAGRVFTFRYAETTELLEAAGCTIATFDPAHDPHLPPGTRGLYLGGGFPEVHAAALSANTSLRADLREAVLDGVPTVAECAGLLYLCRSVDGQPMVGALDAEAVLTPRLTLAYRRPVLGPDQLLGEAGTSTTAHEFHRTTVTPVHGERPVWSVDGMPAGFGGPTLSASYLHVHWAGHPDQAQRFADAVHAGSAHQRAPGPPPSLSVTPVLDVALTDPLRHHGDVEAGDGLLDFAVNVSHLPRPGWLEDALHAGVAASTRYPDASEAHEAVARRHGRDRTDVLLTAGAAEAFVLVARARPWRHPVVVHPQFTEPDVALRAAGHEVGHVLCRPEDGFTLDPALVPDDADLVVVGNPTNPTGRLHSADVLRSLMRPGRVVVVDEAFMDFVPGESETLTSEHSPGLVVIRSLTKLWSMPGIRAGYVVGDPAVVAELSAQQPPWSVGGPALAAVVAASGPDALAEQAQRARRAVRERRILVDGLAELGVEVTGSAAPFVLARLGRGTHAWLRTVGIAVRRADTFPGLDGTWARLAVREPTATRQLLTTLRSKDTWS